MFSYLYLKIRCFSMKKTSSFLILLILLALSSCGSFQVRRTFGEIDGYLHDDPDSAWAEINKIDGASLPTKHLKAYHALLYSLAADKTYHDFTNDSIARIAVDYYDTKGTERHRMLAWYSLGRVQINAEQWTSAIISLTEAEESAEKVRNNFYQGLISRNRAFVYRGVYDNSHALLEIDKAIEYFGLCGKKQYKDYCIYDKIAYLYGDRMTYEAIQLCDSLLSDVTIDQNLRRSVNLIQAQIISAWEDRDGKRIISAYHAASLDHHISLSPLDYSNMGYGYSLLGIQDSVNYYLQCADNRCISRKDLAEVNYNKYRIARISHSLYEEAVDRFSSSMYYEDSLIHVKLNNSVAYSLALHQNERLKAEQLRTEKQSLLFVLISLLAFFVIGVLLSWYWKSRHALTAALTKAAELSDDLSFSEKSRSRLQTLVVNQYRDKLRNLKALSNSYFFWETDNFKKERRRGEFATEGEILEKFRAQLHELRKDREMLVKLEEETDACNDHLISQLRDEFSNLAEKGKRLDETDFRLLVLFLSGFDNHHVAFLSGLDYDLVRKRKSRLSAKLKSQGTPAATSLLALVTKK